MTDPQKIETRLYDHVVGRACPMPKLLNTGELEPEWDSASDLVAGGREDVEGPTTMAERACDVDPDRGRPVDP